MLTAYNGTAISYDAIGNPLNDGMWTYTWQNGRQLASMSKIDGSLTASFVYNADGLRVQKLQRVSPIAQNERRIALRVGTAPYYYLDQFGEYQSAYDYHFMYQTSSGNWAEKHGIGGDSICRYAGETPDSLSWDLANIISYYDSDIVYFAIGE